MTSVNQSIRSCQFRREPLGWCSDEKGATLRDLASLPIRFPRTVVAAFVLLAALALAGLPRLQQEEDLLVFLPTHDADVKLFTDVSRRFLVLAVMFAPLERAF